MIAATLLFGLVQQAGPGWIPDWPEPSALYAMRAESAITVDGRLDELAWSAADWSDPFVDITGRPDLFPVFETRTAVLWTDTALFIGARLQEPHVWGTLRLRDTVIFYDNDFEFFFDPDGDNHRYGEVEINALNTVWDLLLEKPYRDGGPALNEWNLGGMQHAVAVQGTLNDPADTDTGWTVEICIPWRDIADLTDNDLPPPPGTQWRINFSRVQWTAHDSAGVYVKSSPKEDNWVWSPMGVVNMHLPERWGVLEFSAGIPQGATNILPQFTRERRLLMNLYHAQRAYRKETGAWARSMSALGAYVGPGLADRVTMTASGNGFRGVIDIEGDPEARVYTVDHEGRLAIIPQN